MIKKQWERRRSIDLTAARSLAKVAAFPAFGAACPRTESGKHGRESISYKIQHLGIRPFAYLPRDARGSILLIRESISVYLHGAKREKERARKRESLLFSNSRRGYWPVMQSIDIRFSEHENIFLRGLKVTAYSRMRETMAMSIQRRRHISRMKIYSYKYCSVPL